MDYSIIRNLVFSISFLVLIAHTSSRITILKKQLLNPQRDTKGTLLLILFFTIKDWNKPKTPPKYRGHV